MIDASRAWVLQQTIVLDGSLVATATASDYRYDPLNGVSLPRRIQIEIPSANPVSSLTVDLGSVAINQLVGDPAELWSMPQYAGHAAMNLADPNLRFNAPAPVTSAPAASTYLAPLAAPNSAASFAPQAGSLVSGPSPALSAPAYLGPTPQAGLPMLLPPTGLGRNTNRY